MTLTTEQLLNNIPGIVIIKDPESNYLGCSQQAAKLLAGYDNTATIYGKEDTEMPWQAYAHLYREDDLQALAGENVATLQPVTVATGKTFMSIARKNRLSDESGHTTGVIGIITLIYDHDMSQATYSLHKADLKQFAMPPVTQYNLKQQFAGLTKKESECVFYLIRGRNNKEIAAKLALSPRTVETYLNNIKQKWHCISRAQLIDYAIAHGFQHIIPESLLA